MTTVLVCGEPAAARLTEVDGARVSLVHDLCFRLRDLERWVGGDESLVLGVHRSHVDLGSIQAAVRRLGLDPLRVGVLELDTVAADDLELAITAASARSAHSTRADPSQIKLLPPDRSTRRSLLSIGKPRYVCAPGVDSSACHAADGCRVCIDTCPTGALSSDRGTVVHDVNACIACGLCVTACPADAVANPTVHAEAIEAEISAAVAVADAPVGIRYRCRNARVPAQPGWYQVELPCTGMLTPGWLLAALVLGAGAVDVVLCSDGGCPFGNDPKTSTMLRDAQQIADHLGIRLDQPVDSTRIATPGGPLLAAGSTARAALLLAARGSSVAPLSLSEADIGQVTIDPAVCTACERCALVCPSEAITSHHPEGGIELSFDPTRCTACAGCLKVCPEVDGGAISVRRELDLDGLASGPRLVRRETVTACEICGEPVAPTAMLAKIGAMLGEDAERTMSVVGRRCQRCRGR